MAATIPNEFDRLRWEAVGTSIRVEWNDIEPDLNHVLVCKVNYLLPHCNEIAKHIADHHNESIA